MTNNPNSDALLDALRRVGVVIPDLSAIEVRTTKPVVLSFERRYWHVYCGAFDTFVDYRDASNEQDALNVAVSSLQPWYVRKISFAQTPHVESATRNEYIDWLKRGIQ